MAGTFKKRVVSGAYGLNTNYISVENGTTTAANTFTGQYVWVPQYATMRVTVNSDVAGTVTFRFSDDGTTSRSTVVDATVAGTPYWRSVDIQNGFARIEWAKTGASPTTLVVYTAFSRNEGYASLGTGTSGTYIAGPGISITGSVAPYTITNTAMGTSSSGFSAGTAAASVTPALATAAITSIPAITLTYSTFSASSDWTNSGSGKITFTGSVPRAFVFAIQVFYTAGTASGWSWCLYKNGTAQGSILLYSAGSGGSPNLSTGANCNYTATYSPPTGVPSSTGSNIHFSAPVVMANGDFIYAGAANGSGTALTNHQLFFSGAGLT